MNCEMGHDPSRKGDDLVPFVDSGPLLMFLPSRTLTAAVLSPGHSYSLGGSINLGACLRSLIPASWLSILAGDNDND